MNFINEFGGKDITIDKAYILNYISMQMDKNREGESTLGPVKTDFLDMYVKRVIGLTEDDFDLSTIESEITEEFQGSYIDFLDGLNDLLEGIGIVLLDSVNELTFEVYSNVYNVFVLFLMENVFYSFDGFKDYTDENQANMSGTYMNECKEYCEDEGFSSEEFLENLQLVSPDNYCLNSVIDYITLGNVSFDERRFQKYIIDFITSVLPQNKGEI